MSGVDDLVTMLYWVLGILATLFIIDRFMYKPYRDQKNTDQLANKLRLKDNIFYQTLPKFIDQPGIVMVASDNTVLQALLSITTLRKNACKLPILVCYVGEDLSIQNLNLLKSKKDVVTMELSSKVDLPLEALRGDQARVYALIYSPFSQVLLVEPDLLFFQDPTHIFNDTLYQQTGAVFWKDRKVQSVWDKKTYNWIRKLIPYRRGDNRILNKKSATYQSKDLLLINKSTHKKTLEKLWVITKEWDTVYSYVPGDKETYWMAAELASEPYAFVESYPGVIGELHMDVICGHALYFDSQGRLFAWNKSMFNNGDSRFITDFTHYALHRGNTEWSNVIGNSSIDGCLKGAEHIPLPSPMLQLMNGYSQIAHDLQTDLATVRNSSDTIYD